MNVTKPTKIQEELRRIAAVIRSGATGPLIAAEDVVRLANEWDVHKADCDGMSATAAFKKHLGFPLPYFEARARAVDELGRDIRGWMAHDLAVWVLNVVPEAMRKSTKEKLLFAFAEQRKRGLIVTKNQAQRAVYSAIGHVSKPTACDSCARLRSKLVEMGVDPATVT